MTVVHTARAPRDPGRPRIALAAGTRPEWLKLASTMRRLHELDPKSMVVLDIQQQPELVGSLLAEYGLQQLPRVRVASGGPGLADRFGTTTKAVARTLETLPCAALVVQGDTTSALAAALAGFYARVPVVHVEAGLRSGDLAAPFPEEGHRAMISQLATWHVPTNPDAERRLLAHGVPQTRMLTCGNPLFDLIPGNLQREGTPAGCRTVLVTMHRRENRARGLPALCAALGDLAGEDPTLRIMVISHPHPAIRDGLAAHLDGRANVRLVPPLSHRSFLTLLARSRLVLTDSGGVQEEAAWLGRDTLLLRRVPDRPDGLAEGHTIICEPERATILAKARALLSREARPVAPRSPIGPVGDAIAAMLLSEFVAPRTTIS